ncbi:putative lectin C-type domain containing [Triplophysa rosa]|uniref:Lectin C-type domain containing n=1 Tax=Triplophysa rosa TaxID=992332 RepID=A0A9W7WBB4_TRIRA|nr:putative lectin C-type domain containing [Triplophysa rosa]
MLIFLFISTNYHYSLCSLSECIQNHYYYINMNMNWTEAQRYCREKYTDLATVNDMNHMNELKKIVNNNLAHLWIGLRNTGVYIWKWSLGDPVNYLNWLSEPTNSLYNCAVMRNGTWRQQDCNVKSGFICYNDSSKAYIIEPSSKTWREAQSFCRQNHTDLINVRNQTDNHLIQNIINDTQRSVWIGLFRDSFEWSDNSDSAFRYWDSGEPSFRYGTVSEDCAEFRMDKQGTWNDSPCRNLQTFLCHEGEQILTKPH